MKIIVTTFYDQNYKVLADKTNPNHQAYCNLHGYEYRTRELPYAFQGTGYEALCRMGYENSNFVMTNLQGMKDGEYLFTIGCDAVFMFLHMSLEGFINLYKDAEIITGSDWDGINSSQMMIKSGPIARAYFGEMNRWIQNGGEHDQAYMKKVTPDFIAIAHQRHINSYDHELRNETFDKNRHWQDGDFLIHLAGSTLEQRMGAIDKWLGRVN